MRNELLPLFGLAVCLALAPATADADMALSAFHPGADRGDHHALIISISEYSALEVERPDLPGIAKGTEALVPLLEDRLGFEVTVLADDQATRAGILAALEDLRSDLDQDDTLLVYFAGYGGRNSSLGQSFWVPSDATDASYPEVVSNHDVVLFLRAMDARHVLLVDDSMDSGFVQQLDMLEPALFEASSEHRQGVLRTTRSRWALSCSAQCFSGEGDTPFEEVSPIAAGLMAALQGAEGPAYPMATLVQDLRAAMSDPAQARAISVGAIYGAGHEGGEPSFPVFPLEVDAIIEGEPHVR